METGGISPKIKLYQAIAVMEMIEICFFDASAAVKRYIDEKGFEKLSSYGRDIIYMTNICVMETLNVFKLKWKRGEISQDQYFEISYEFCSELGSQRIQVQDLNLSDFEVFYKAEEIAKKYHLDLSDALQIYSLKHIFTTFVGKSTPLLVTFDKDLAKGARQEGVNVWNEI